jgi:dihydrofolate reductase
MTLGGDAGMIKKILNNNAGLLFFHDSVESALRAANRDRSMFIGGHGIYKEALGLVDCLWVTRIEKEFAHADAFMPNYEEAFQLVEAGIWMEHNGMSYRFEHLQGLTRG